MNPTSGPRRMLLAAKAAAVAVVASTAPAQAAEIRGTVQFEGGAAIPKGQVEIYLDLPALHDKARHEGAKTRIESDGGSEVMEFSLSWPAGATASAGTQVVARLERADGWLLARGSAKVEAGSPVHITLYTAMY